MAAPQVEVSSTPASCQTDTAAPRKRRKRAPAAGAAADCFTCSTRSVKCDRRRPYCSQCLDDGKDCSGYKTQLTWGVGVASRGKLRGLSLPIAGTQKLAGPLSSARQKKRVTGSTSNRAVNIQKAVPGPIIVSPNPARSNGSFQFDAQATSPPLHSPYQQTSWVQSTQSQVPMPLMSEIVKPEPSDPQYSMHPAPLPLPLPSPDEHNMFAPARTPMLQFGNRDRISPMSYSAPSPEVQYFAATSRPGTDSLSASLPNYPISPHQQLTFHNPFGDSSSLAAYPRPDESYVRNDVYEPPLSSTFQEPPETI